MTFTAEEMSTLQKYLQSKFGHTGFALKMRDKANDSVEVLLNGEFIAVIYKNIDEGETSYDFNMAILDIDLRDAA
ncbi:MAG: hypothetical protein CMH27_04620 [Micavibrio sp.]|nr:hypothetical protein [Micavibrio sp.]|tara:strand:+ start:4360 stop:4584 length:225 start_codon:yes stop_codon:yes gene_type:complete